MPGCPGLPAWRPRPGWTRLGEAIAVAMRSAANAAEHAAAAARDPEPAISRLARQAGSPRREPARASNSRGLGFVRGERARASASRFRSRAAIVGNEADIQLRHDRRTLLSDEIWTQNSDPAPRAAFTRRGNWIHSAPQLADSKKKSARNSEIFFATATVAHAPIYSCAESNHTLARLLSTPDEKYENTAENGICNSLNRIMKIWKDNSKLNSSECGIRQFR
jgi:hypothetical protein